MPRDLALAGGRCLDLITGTSLLLHAEFALTGCWGLVQGAVRLFLCTTFPEALPCASIQPQLSMLDAVLFALQVGVGWVGRRPGATIYVW